MDGILITIIVITAFLVYKMISSSRKQEGYKRWKATSSGKEEKTTKVKWEHGAWLRHALGETVPRAQYVQKFDESIQTTINSRILSSVTMIHPAAVGFRSGHSVVDNASPHLGKRYILKMDIHDFFFSIRSRRVKKTFEKIGYPENVSKVLGVLCCLYRHLPQGAPTSPALSNIVGYEMDKKLAALAAEYGLTYTRYADDLTFSGDVFPKEQIIPRIKQIIRDEKFEPNHKKTRFINEYGRKIITGVSVSSGAKLTIPKARKREIRKNVYFILTKGLAEHQRRIGSSDPVYLKRLTGELCYWRSIEPDNAYVSDSINRLKCLEKGY